MAAIFDMEMCRLGTESMQLESMFFQCGPEGVPWEGVVEGYEATTGRTVAEEDYIFMLAKAVFYFHIRISRSGRPNAARDWVGHFLPEIRGRARQ